MSVAGVAIKRFERVVESDGSVFGFVLKSWLRTHDARGVVRHGLNYKNKSARDAYYSTYRPAIIKLLASTPVVLGVVDEDHDTFLGFACGSPGLLHYVYVRETAREHGLGEELVREACGNGPLIYTFEPSKPDGRLHRTFAAVAERRGWKFHPHPVPGMAVHKQKEAMRA